MAGSMRAEERARADLLRGILDLALGVARIDASNDLATVPPELRSVVRHTKVVPRARAAADRAGADEAFRSRIAEAVDADELTPAERLWLERPEGWEDGLGDLVAAKVAEDEEGDARRSLSRERRARRTAEEGRERAEGEREALRAELVHLRDLLVAERETAADAAEKVARAEADRRDAVRRLKELETAHARLHEQVREEREASEEREPSEAAPAASPPMPPDAAVTTDQGALDPSGTAAADAGGGDDAGDGRGADPLIDPGVAPAVARAASAASVLADALADVAGLLDSETPVEPGASEPGDPALGAGNRRARTTDRRRRSADRRRAGRRPAPLPGGVHDDSDQAAAHLVRLRDAALLVDGYNASMATWPEHPISEQRQRLLSALDGLEARVGIDTTVVFDGVAAGPGASPGPGRVRVTFTDADVEADDVILDLVDLLPAHRPVVVASDDRRVQDGARRRGANVIGIPQLRSLLV